MKRKRSDLVMEAEASSSSLITSETPIHKKFDVFISFKGTDTRDNIVSHIYDRLCRSNIQTFIDNELERGDEISASLLRKIEESKISLVVFSKNYASSRWCLNELLKIMDCYNKNEQIVIPVFFKVDPSEVRKQSDTFGEALAQNEGDSNMQRWRDALTKAANLSGWDSQVTTHEAALVTSIVTDISGKLFDTPSSDLGDMIGMSSHFNQIESILSRIHNEVCIIGLWGMGGIGKTTLARTFFHYNLSRFEGHCILENIREKCEKGGLNELQEKLVTGLLKDNNFNEGTLNIRIPSIWNMLRRKKVLIVLDDVNDCRHIRSLIGGRDSVGQGSIIIITSRDKQVLKNFVDDTYEVRGLDDSESLRLFSLHAFKEEHPRDDHQMRLSNKAINYAKGNPLALEVMGSDLFGRSKEEQESVLKKLERTPNMDVQKILLISYNGLEYQEQELFLNIACFFKGMSEYDFKRFHDGSYDGYSADFGVLINKCLITRRHGQVWMHDLIQEMGKQIVREKSIEEPGKRSRLWDDGDICHVLTKNTGTEAVKSVLLDSIPRRQLSIDPEAFESMPNLEFLKIVAPSSTLCFTRGLGGLPNNLRYIYWEEYPLKSMPSIFHPENLVYLIMRNSHVERLWNGIQNLVHLKRIDLCFSKKLIEIPDLSLAKNLEEMHLAFCERLKNLQVRNISNLKILNLPCCPLINKFPEVPSKIQRLDLDWTGIEEIPSTISNLKSLVTLYSRGRKNIPEHKYELKEYWYNPPTELSYHTMNAGLINLCEEEEEANILPRELTPFERLSSLAELDLGGSHFQEIPFAIKQLINLKELYVQDCWRLQSLPQLPMNVRILRADNCISLETVVSSPFSSARGVYDYYNARSFDFQFPNCYKLDQDSRNGIMAYVERTLLKWKAILPEILSPFDYIAPGTPILFSGGDIPDWFDYKSWGSSLTVKLPPRWCNSELFCLVFSAAVELNEPIDQGGIYFVGLACYVKLRGERRVYVDWSDPDILTAKNDPKPNHVIVIYNLSLVNEWRRKYKEESDIADEISIRFSFPFRVRGRIRQCGFHLLYTSDVENRYCRSVVQPNSTSGDLTKFMDDVEESMKTQYFLKHDWVEDVEESMMQEDAKGNRGHNNDNSCNVGKPIEGWHPPQRRRNKMKWNQSTFKFVKFLRVRRKLTRKVWRNNCKFRV